MNKQSPGLPNYTGPTEAVFGLVHHKILYEYSHDINERLKYIDKHKDPHEIPIRRRSIIYLPKEVFPELYGVEEYKAWVEAYKVWVEAYQAWVEAYKVWVEAYQALDEAYQALDAADKAWDEANKAWDEAYKARDAADKAWSEATAHLKLEIEKYILANVPDCTWDGEEMVFE